MDNRRIQLAETVVILSFVGEVCCSNLRRYSAYHNRCFVPLKYLTNYGK
jgi:hypothetical protein